MFSYKFILFVKTASQDIERIIYRTARSSSKEFPNKKAQRVRRARTQSLLVRGAEKHKVPRGGQLGVECLSNKRTAFCKHGHRRRIAHLECMRCKLKNNKTIFCQYAREPIFKGAFFSSQKAASNVNNNLKFILSIKKNLKGRIIIHLEKPGA
jgi:hypothetical protein